MGDLSCYREAILQDGLFVLCEVVNKLYKGGNQRPDILFSRDARLRQLKYSELFNSDQRRSIERSGKPYSYKISNGTRSFDVSLLILLVDHVCGLGEDSPLLRQVHKFRKMRNMVAHPSSDTIRGNFNKELDELLDLYINIINNLEKQVNYHLTSVIDEVRRKILQRKYQQSGRNVMQSENSNQQTWQLPVRGEITVQQPVNVQHGFEQHDSAELIEMISDWVRCRECLCLIQKFLSLYKLARKLGDTLFYCIKWALEHGEIIRYWGIRTIIGMIIIYSLVARYIYLVPDGLKPLKAALFCCGLYKLVEHSKISEEASESTGHNISIKGNGTCKHCGYPHRSENCRFKNLVCRNCNRKGHLERVCRFPSYNVQGCGPKVYEG